jgi:predicted nucleic acid-binding Zn ribbon protein
MPSKSSAMSFNSLERLIQKWEDRPELQQIQQFRQIVAAWLDVVGTPVAKHTRPHSLNRGMLFVATSSPAWAQNLTFQRYQILNKLNPLLSQPIAEIRFSTAQWQNAIENAAKPTLPHSVTQVSHPPILEAKDPVTAFQNWAEIVQKRSQHLPLCPQCQCPTPNPEIDRWGICALCSAKNMAEG